MIYEIEWIWQAKIDITLPSKSTKIMRMNESLELDVYRAGIRQSPVFTRISPQTRYNFPELRTKDDKTIFLILLKYLLQYSLRIFILLSSPNKNFKMTNNKSRTQNATKSTWWLIVAMIHTLGSHILTKRGQGHDTNIAQQRMTTTRERITRKLCTHNDHFSVNTDNFMHYSLTKVRTKHI